MSGIIYGELRRDIASGELAPGATLVESALASQFGVSRTPIREALMQLVSDGLIERRGRSFAVTSRTPEEILDIYDVRILLESAAAEWAASRRTELDLRRLTNAHEHMRLLSDDGPMARQEANTRFHEEVWLASHSPTLVDSLKRLTVQLHRFPQTTLDYPGRWETAVGEHGELLEAIVERRPERAREVASRHMSEARDIRLTLYAPVSLS